MCVCVRTHSVRERARVHKVEVIIAFYTTFHFAPHNNNNEAAAAAEQCIEIKAS
jgi:hypothetical protein